MLIAAALILTDISDAGVVFIQNGIGPVSYTHLEWRWLGGKVLCVVFAGMMLAFVPKILKKRG